MSELLIHKDEDGEWNVWITLPDHDALHDPFGFIIGTGKTRDEAVAAAVKDLEATIEILQLPERAESSR